MPNNFLSEFQNFFREIDHIRILEEFRKNSEGKAADLPQFCQSPSLVPFLLNTSDLTDSYVIFTLKMEFVSKNTIFGLKLMVKFHHTEVYFALLNKSVQNHKFSNSSRMEKFQKYFSRPLFTIIFRQKNVFFDTDSILRVKTMHESVK